MNLHIARAYLSAVDPRAANRTWKNAMVEGAKTKTGPTRMRWESAMRDKALVKLKDMQLLQTRAEHFTEALVSGTVSTNMFLRRLHSFAADTGWLPWPVLRDYYELLWHVGGPQTDMALLTADNVDWDSRTIFLHAGENGASGDCALQRHADGNVATPMPEGFFISAVGQMRSGHPREILQAPN